MVPFKQTSVKLKQIVHGIRWVFGALQRELCHIYPQDGENEKSSRWAESSNLLPTEHPRPLEVSPPTRKSKTCVQEKENIGVLSNPKTLVKNKITWVKVVGRNGGSRRWHKEGGELVRVRVPFAQTSVKSKQIVHGIRWVLGLSKESFAISTPKMG